MAGTDVYMAKVGFNQDFDFASAPGATYGYSDKVPLQPYSPGVKATRRTLMGDGSILDQGLYVEWIYSVVESAAQLTTVLAPLGLDVAKTQEVTIWTRDDLYVFRRYNGVAQRPPASWENYFARNVVILICNLKLLPNVNP